MNVAEPTERPGFDPGVAHPARAYNFWLGGKDHFAADREAGQEVMRLRPEIVAGARANREFLARVVRYLVGRGIKQFLDVGSGLPAPDNVHEVAQRVDPWCRVVYVDRDPLVLMHSRALLTSGQEGSCDYLEADLRDVDLILKEASRTLDLTQPVALLLLAVLQLIPDEEEPGEIVAALVSSLAPGSYVAISHMTSDFAPGAVTAAARAYNERAAVPVTARSHSQVSELFSGYQLVAPGIVPITSWRRDQIDGAEQVADLYGGIALTSRLHWRPWRTAVEA
jgi:S-adenosyl methyltransferase